MRNFLIGLSALALSSCTLMSAGNLEKNYDLPQVTNSGPGNIIIYVALDAESNSAQRTRDMSSTVDSAGSLGMDSGQGTIAREGGSVLLDGLKNVVEKWMNNEPVDDHSSVDSSTTTEGSTGPDNSGPGTIGPEPVAPVEPANDLISYYAGKKVSVDGILYPKFIFPRLGPDYGSEFKLVYSNGNELNVPDSTRMTMRADNTKYQPGGPFSGNPDIPTMEVYSPLNTNPEWVKIILPEAPKSD